MKFTRRFLLFASVALVGAIGVEQASWAERHEDWHGGRHEDWHGPHFGGDIRFFHEHDWDLWRGGHWEHAFHDGRSGWWWIAGDAWYFYPEPVYPYPDPYVPPLAEITPPAQLSGDLPPQPKSWYHCSSPNGYYPYVTSCPSGWRAVPATPGQPPVASAPPPR